jgi:hypothetical protein
MAESIAPGQRNLLLQLAQLENVVERRPAPTTASSTSIDEQYLGYLVKMYNAYEEKHFGFDERVRLLSLIPDSWGLSKEQICEKFQCSITAVKAARRLRESTDTPLHMEDKE